MIVLAHLSDTHVDGTERNAARTRAVMDYLDALPTDLDAVLVTGDVTDRGQAAEYRQSREVLASRHTVLACPGNHDDRAAFREVLLGEPAAGGPVNRVHRTDSAVYLLADTSVPGHDHGRLDDETVSWLEDVLAGTSRDTPVLLAFHHPPAELHSPFIDAIRQVDEDRLAAVVSRHPNVAATFCGHAHTAAATSFAGRPLRVAPGVASTLRLPWERGSEDDVLDLRPPPGLAFHLLDDTGRLTTHYRVVT